jgi:hypothetical protein
MSDNTLTITWEAYDGYCGGSAPQHLSISVDELAECANEDDAFNLVVDAIEEDFRQKVSATYDESEIREAIRKAREEANERYED